MNFVNLHAHSGVGSPFDGFGYPHLTLTKNGAKKSTTVHKLMHRTFMPLEVGVVDHIDRNPANNKLENLRIVTTRENLSNTKRNKRLMGAYFLENSPRIKKWHSSICLNGSRINIGYFKTEIEAHKAYVNARKLIDLGMNDKAEIRKISKESEAKVEAIFSRMLEERGL